jgi:O-antigen/teichoic acid export membrane protein
MRDSADQGTSPPTDPRSDDPGSFRQTARRTSLVFSANLGGTALGFLANILIMRSLGPAGFGVVVVSLTLLNVLWQLTGRGLDQALVRCIARMRQTEPDRADAAMATAHRAKLVLGGLLAAVGLVLAPTLTQFFFGDAVSPAPVAIAIVSSLAASVWGYVGACLQARHEFGRYSLVVIVNAASRLLLVATLVGLGHMTTAWALGSLGLGYGLASVVGYMMCPSAARSVQGRRDLQPILYTSSRWLILSSVLHLLYSRVDQLMLSRLVSSSAAGVFGAAATFIQLVDLLTASLLTVILPKTCESTDSPALRRHAWTSLRVSFLLVVPMTAGFFLADPVIGRLVPDFEQTSFIFKIILAGALFNVLTHPLQVILHARGHTRRILFLDVALLLISVVANYLVIPSYGALGAAVVALGLRLLAGSLLLVLVGVELVARPHGLDPGMPEQPPRVP